MFKTHRKIYQRLKLENIYSIYIFSQFFLAFIVLFVMIVNPNLDKGIFIEVCTLFVGILTYIDILIRMRSK